MIDDYTEDGCTEQEAIRRIGTPGDIAREILAEQKDSPEASTPSSKKVLTTVLLIIGSPLWASVLLLIVALALSFAAMAVCLAAAGALLVLTAYVMLWCVPLMIASLSIGALVLSVISLIGAIPVGIGAAFNGSRTGNDSQLTMDFTVLNGNDTQNLILKKGDILDVDISVNSGSLNVNVQKIAELSESTEIQNQDKSIRFPPIYRRQNLTDDTCELVIPEDGIYSVTIVGQGAAGKVSFIKRDMDI